MKLLNKIREKGLAYALSIAYILLCNQINRIVFNICKCFPIDSRVIIFESESDYTDNAQALYNFFSQTTQYKNYKIIWLVDNLENFSDRKDAIFVCKKPNTIQMKTYYYLARCRYYIYDHNNLFAPLKKRSTQYILYLSHGFGFKVGKGMDYTKVKTHFDHVISLGDIPAQGIAQFSSVTTDKVINLGFPRNDYFFTDLSEIQKKVDEKYSFSKYKKVILWMPTFRQSNVKSISENYLKTETGLPLFNSESDLHAFNDFLKNQNNLVVLKLHPLQAKLPIFDIPYSNIKIIKNEDLSDLGVQLYQFIPLFSYLISDYSSISVDFMLLKKPIIYILDDLEEYRNSRGIWPSNALDLMPGYHVFTIQDLVDAIKELNTGADVFETERNLVLNKLFDNPDGQSSKRIIEYLQL